MLEDARQILRDSRKATNQHQQWTHGTDSKESDDMLVLGDHTTHVYPPPRTDWGKVLLGTGLLATGIGGPLGGLLLWHGLTQPPTTNAVKEQESSPSLNDQDTIFSWELQGGIPMNLPAHKDQQ